MPMTRRLPKRGFNNAMFRVEYQEVRVGDLELLGANAEVSLESLVDAGLIKARKGPAKILSNGDISVAVTVRGMKVSEGAKAKIEAAGGRVES
jgi:large subunit ribosomal protein L15